MGETYGGGGACRKEHAGGICDEGLRAWVECCSPQVQLSASTNS